MTWVSKLVASLAAVCLVGMFYLANVSYENPVYLILVVPFLICVSVFLAGFVLRRQHREYEEWKALVRAHSDSRSERIGRIHRNSGPRWIWRDQHVVSGGQNGRVVKLLRQATGNAGVITIADSRVKDPLQRIEINEHLTEPAKIDTDSSMSSRWAIALSVLAGIVVISSLIRRDWWFTSFYLVMLAFYLTSTRRVRLWLRDESYLELSRLTISPGVVTDVKGRKWTIDDSIMVIGRHWNGKIQIELIGVDQLLRLTYDGLDHPDFVALWQNWNHPNPRPELVD